MGLSLSPQIKAATFSANFDNGVPAGTAVYGNTLVEPSGGVGDSGVLKITNSSNGQNGAFVIDDIDEGNAIYGFDMTFKLRIDGAGSTPADGFSVNFAPDLPDAVVAGGVEEGVGSGLSIAFDIFDNGAAEGPNLAIKLGSPNNVIATKSYSVAQISTGNTFADVHILVKPNGSVTLTYKGETVFDNVFLPGYSGIAGRFGFFGRTGGLNANQWVDDLQITTSTTPEVGIATQPASVTLVPGRDATFTVAINNGEGSTLQWFKNGVAIPDETGETLTVPAVSLADSGTKYTLKVTGPNGNATSQEAVLTVRDIAPTGNLTYSYDFNTDIAPEDAYVTGTSFIDTVGGVDDSGVLKITTGEQSLSGTFIINDALNAAKVFGFTAQFDIRVGEGSTLPADGFSFNFASDIPDAPAAGEYENGLGSGLTVGFDIYLNAPEVAPTIDVRYQGQLITSVPVPLSFIETGSFDTGFDFQNVIIRLEDDATLDVVYKGVVIIDNLLIPNFTSISGGRFVLAGRTGGEYENVWVDNLQISVDQTAGDLRITGNGQPAAQDVLLGKSGVFTVGVNDTEGVTYQWFKNGSAISGATSASYTTPATTAEDQGSLYSVAVTKGGVTVTSNTASLNVVTIPQPVNPQINFDFNNGELPAGTQLFFTGANTAPFVDTTGGVDDSGALKLTLNEGGMNASFVIPPLEGGAEIGSLTGSFDIRLGQQGGNPPADGISFNWASDLPDGTIAAAEGQGNGLSIVLDTWDNGAGEAPAIDLKWKNVFIASKKVPIAFLGQDDNYRNLSFQLTDSGVITVAYNDTVIFNHVQIPNYTPLANAKFIFAATTGGAVENHWVDNIRIRGEKTVGPLSITTDLNNALLFSGQTATFNVGVSDPATATYKWYRNGVLITGANGASYTTPALTAGADNGARYSVVATGPGGEATSREAVVTVVDPISVTNPDIFVNFDDQIPADAIFLSSAGGGYLNGFGGVDDSGSFVLTDAATGQGGSVVLPNANNNEEVDSFTASFKMFVGNGSGTPADGFSFIWANDTAPSVPFGEGGAGDGLIVVFDAYKNVEEAAAPKIDIIYKTAKIASVVIPYSQFQTDNAFADAVVRVEADGTLDVHYNGHAIYSNLQLPGFTPLSNSYFGIGGRTGGEFEMQVVDDIKIDLNDSVITTGPTLSIAKGSGNNVVISWEGGGVLESAPTIDSDTWTPLDPGTSPVTIPATQSAQFFRVRK
jgi:hypothetical protein